MSRERPMARTRATQVLDKAGISYELRTYSYDPNTERIGVHAAESLGVPTDQVLKTLLAAGAGYKFTYSLQDVIAVAGAKIADLA